MNPIWHSRFVQHCPAEYRENIEMHSYPGAGHLIEPPYMPHIRAVEPGSKRMKTLDFMPEKYHGTCVFYDCITRTPVANRQLNSWFAYKHMYIMINIYCQFATLETMGCLTVVCFFKKHMYICFKSISSVVVSLRLPSITYFLFSVKGLFFLHLHKNVKENLKRNKPFNYMYQYVLRNRNTCIHHIISILRDNATKIWSFSIG